MKKYLFFAAAAMVFAACAEKGFDSHKPAEKGEMEQSYLAVSLMSDDMTTRAAGDVYEEGDPSERFVNTFHFFLFDEKGDPFIIDGDTNYKPFEIKENENDFGTNNPGNEEGEGNEEDILKGHCTA